MTQHELIIKYIEFNEYIIPAKLNDKNRAFMGDWIGSEAGKRCRELRKAGKLVSVKEGKFEKFFLKETLPIPDKPNPIPPLNVLKQALTDTCSQDYHCWHRRKFRICKCVRTWEVTNKQMEINI